MFIAHVYRGAVMGNRLSLVKVMIIIVFYKRASFYVAFYNEEVGKSWKKHFVLYIRSNWNFTKYKMFHAWFFVAYNYLNQCCRIQLLSFEKWVTWSSWIYPTDGAPTQMLPYLPHEDDSIIIFIWRLAIFFCKKGTF